MDTTTKQNIWMDISQKSSKEALKNNSTHLTCPWELPNITIELKRQIICMNLKSLH